MQRLLSDFSNAVFLSINDLSDKEYEDALKNLSPQKLERVNKIRTKEDKLRSVCADICARRAVSKITGKDFENICISYDFRDRPFFEDVFVSISHSGEYAVSIANKNPVGIDIEKIRPNLRRNIVKKICTTNDELTFADNENYKEKAIIIWTIKEACFKALIPQPKILNEIKLNLSEKEFSCNGISRIRTQRLYKDYIISVAFCDNTL